jgi:ribonuclease Z
MSKIIFLGTAHAIPDVHHENTHLALLGEHCLALIDAPNNPTVRLKQAGLDYRRLTDLILTHFHPDHVGGAPSLIMNLWLLGRKDPLRIHGLAHTVERIEKVMELYDWGSWPNFYPVDFHKLPEEPMTCVLENQDFQISASPVRHLVAGIGLRILALASGKVAAYSGDTKPCQEVVQLARDSDALIHEASGAVPGHSSARQAGEIAQKAGAKSLYLIHYPTEEINSTRLIEEARMNYAGEARLARDLDTLEL